MMWHRIGMWVVATIVASQGAWAGDAAPQVPRAARTLHAFDGADGRQPTDLLRLDDGTLFGSTTLGGPGGSGVLYRIASDGSFAIVHAFTDTPDGAIPQRLIRTQDGSIYSLAAAGGAFGAGAIFRANADGTDFAYVTHSSPAAPTVRARNS